MAEQVPLKQQSADPLASILDFSKYIAGSKTGGQTGETTATKGQTAPLEALIASMSDPTSLANLVANLFSQGAQQVPVLSSQFANATGTRVSNNSMLGQSLAMLHSNIAQTIAQSVVQQQQAAAKAAADLGQTNKTTSGQKVGNQTTKPGDLKTAAGTAAVTAGAGMLANKFGDLLLKKMGIGSNTPVAPAPIATTAPIDVSASAGPAPSFDLPTSTSGAFFTGDLPTTFDASGFGTSIGSSYTPDFPVAEDTGGLDSASVGSSVGSAAATDFGSSAGSDADLSGIFDNVDFSGFFRDGGTVGAGRGSFPMLPPGAIVILPRPELNSQPMPTNMRVPGYANGGTVKTGMGKMKGYADGGDVATAEGSPLVKRRGVANMGAATASGTGNPAVNFAAPDVLQLMQKMQEAQRIKLGQPSVRGADVPTDGGTSTEGGPPGVEGQNAFSVNPMSVAIALALNPVTNPFAIANVVANNVVMQAINQALFGPDAAAGIDTGPTPASVDSPADTSGVTSTSNTPGVNAFAPDTTVASNVDVGFFGPDPSAPPSTSNDSPNTGPSVAPPGDTADPADSGNDAGDSGGVSGGDSGDGGDGAGGSGPGGDGGASGSAGYATGGTVRARSSRQLGIDRVPARLTPGEFVVPVDTADFIGRDVLQDIVDLTHIPL